MTLWKFLPVRPGDRLRESTLAEFFNTNAIDDVAEALVREGVQNSMDAATGEAAVRVRIFLSGEDTSPTVDLIRPYIENLEPHLRACDLSLPRLSEQVRFLVFEDFNTSGLTGDVEQWRKSDDDNPFFSFFRAEGWSQKSEGGGRWGIGKFAFTRASRLRVHFGLTVRADDQRQLLVGQTILLHHTADDTYYMPDGWYGEFKDTLGLPVEGQSLAEFSALFYLSREREQAGLSVVVPFIDEEVEFASVLRGVVKDYFFPILREQLVVEVQNDSESPLVVDRAWLESGEAGPMVAKELPALLELATWYVGGPEISAECDASEGRPEWRGDTICDRPAALEAAQSAERFVVRVHVSVRRKDESAERAHFDMVYERDDAVREAPVFIRDYLRVSDVGASQPSGFRVLVLIPGGPLADMLGDAENPAHTSWSARAERFVGKYEYGQTLLSFIRSAPAAFVRAALGDEELRRNVTLLADVFGAVAEPGSEGRAVPGKRTGSPGEGVTPTERPELPIHRPPYVINPSAPGSFVVKGTGEGRTPAEILLKVAYDTRAGSPLKKYSRYDFELGKAPIEVTTTGCRAHTLRNVLKLIVESDDFEARVSGFDHERDLFLQPRATYSEGDE